MGTTGVYGAVTRVVCGEGWQMRGPREETVERQETAGSGVGKSEEMSSATPEFRE